MVAAGAQPIGLKLFSGARNWRICGCMKNFLKMHGLGNDFIILDARGDSDFSVSPAAARALCDRRRGIGCDQLLIIRDSDTADIIMEILNSDGSASEACGNGTRCVADVLMQETGADRISIDTTGGLLAAHYDTRMGERLVAVDMGPVGMGWQDVPLNAEMDTLHVPLGHDLPPAVCHSMGNPHAVVFVDDVAQIDLASIGPLIETSAAFPQRVNLSFVQQVGPAQFRMRVWERGAGITMACGSGACAVGVAIHRRCLGGRQNEIIMDGGPVHIDWIDDGSEAGRVMLIGPVAYAFAGELSQPLQPLLEHGHG